MSKEAARKLIKLYERERVSLNGILSACEQIRFYLEIWSNMSIENKMIEIKFEAMDRLKEVEKSIKEHTEYLKQLEREENG